MNKRRVVLLIFAILIMVASGIFVLDIKDKIPNNIFCFLDIGTYKVPPMALEVNSSRVLGQEFVSNFDNLFMITVFVPQQDLHSDKELTFHLKHSIEDSEDLATLKFKFNQIKFKENDFYLIPPDRESTKEGFHFCLQFPNIKYSKDKIFYFYFEAPKAGAGEGMKLGIWDNANYYEGLRRGRLFINLKPARGFLAFRTYNTWKGSAPVLWEEIKLRFLKDRVFFIFYAVILVVLLLAIVVLSLKIQERN